MTRDEVINGDYMYIRYTLRNGGCGMKYTVSVDDLFSEFERMKKSSYYRSASIYDNDNTLIDEFKKTKRKRSKPTTAYKLSTSKLHLYVSKVIKEKLNINTNTETLTEEDAKVITELLTESLSCIIDVKIIRGAKRSQGVCNRRRVSLRTHKFTVCVRENAVEPVETLIHEITHCFPNCFNHSKEFKKQYIKNIETWYGITIPENIPESVNKTLYWRNFV